MLTECEKFSLSVMSDLHKIIHEINNFMNIATVILKSKTPKTERSNAMLYNEFWYFAMSVLPHRPLQLL